MERRGFSRDLKREEGDRGGAKGEREGNFLGIFPPLSFGTIGVL